MPTAPRAVTAWRIAAIAALAGLAAAGHAWYGLRNKFFDLHIYAAAMRWWDDGHPLYDFAVPDATQGQLGYTYPPFAAIVMRPLAWITLGAADVLSLIAAAAALLLVAYCLTARLADRLGQPRWFLTGLAVPLLTGIEPIRVTVDFGQVNLLLMALVLGDLLILGPRRSRFAGVGVGLAAAIKLVPAIFIVYALATRRWRVAAVAAGTTVGATLLAGALAPTESWRFWSQTLRNLTGIGQLEYFSNQSLLGALARAGVPETALWLALALPMCAFGLWRARRAAQAGDEITAIALVGLTGGLVSPVTWHHHLVWLAPAVASLATAALLTRRRLLLAGTLACYACLVFSPLAYYQDHLLHPGGIVRPLLVNWYVWLALLLVVVLPVTRPAAREDRAPHTEPTKDALVAG
ncbi:glycosyltransferase 87 family protein [Luedemannella helvata]|uniref:Alpha-1,2-mannosyltransferase n=1 Tax=Luedemannella helvata TaxID=349315 RepID=A0ABP4WKU4_9ACTN